MIVDDYEEDVKLRDCTREDFKGVEKLYDYKQSEAELSLFCLSNRDSIVLKKKQKLEIQFVRTCKDCPEIEEFLSSFFVKVSIITPVIDWSVYGETPTKFKSKDLLITQLSTKQTNLF